MEQADQHRVVTNQASVTSDTFDPDPSNNMGESTVAIAGADLSIEKSLRGGIRPGSTATYRLAVTNNGPSDTAGPVTVTDHLPTGLTFASVYAQGWNCSSSGTAASCTSHNPMDWCWYCDGADTSSPKGVHGRGFGLVWSRDRATA